MRLLLYKLSNSIITDVCFIVSCQCWRWTGTKIPLQIYSVS